MDNGLPKGPTKSEGRRPAEEAKRPTNLITLTKEAFVKGIPNLGTLDLKFITLHPYKKDKNFLKNLVLSKVSDKVRRRSSYFIITREENAILGHYHYHVLGYFPKGSSLVLKGFKVWTHVVEPLVVTSTFTPVREMFKEFIGDPDNIKLEFDSFKKKKQLEEGKKLAKEYWHTKLSQMEQIEFIIDYIFKYAREGTLYKDYIVSLGKRGDRES